MNINIELKFIDSDKSIPLDRGSLANAVKREGQHAFDTEMQMASWATTHKDDWVNNIRNSSLRGSSTTSYTVA